MKGKRPAKPDQSRRGRQPAEPGAILDHMNRRRDYIVLTDRRLAGHKPHTLSVAIRGVAGPQWGTGPEAIRKAHKDEDYNIPGLAIAALEEAYGTITNKAFAFKLAERDLREAFFGRSEKSIHTALTQAEVLVSSNDHLLKDDRPVDIHARDWYLDRMAYYSLCGQYALYAARIEECTVSGRRKFIDAASIWEDCYNLSVKNDGNSVSANKKNYPFCMTASAAAANLFYALARAHGIDSIQVAEKAVQIINPTRCAAARHIADLLKDPRISYNHAEMAFIVRDEASAAELTKLTIRLSPDSLLKDGRWQNPKWVFAEAPKQVGFDAFVEKIAKAYAAEMGE